MRADPVVATIEVPSPSDPAAALAAVVALRRLADRLELAAANAAVEQGWSWTDVAGALGISRQAAHKKFARRGAPRSDRPVELDILQEARAEVAFARSQGFDGARGPRNRIRSRSGWRDCR